MSSFRVTSNGIFRNYRSNLMKSNKKLSDSMLRVETHRNFNTYAENPAAASEAFQKRRSLWRTYDQIENSDYIVSKFSTGWSAMEDIVDGDSANDTPSLDGIAEQLRGLNGPTGSGRASLGQSLLAKADSIVKSMNVRYGDEFVFAGADGMNAPFAWDDDGNLTYRGVDVTNGDAGTLKAMAQDEHTYADIGLGIDEKDLANTAYDTALPGLRFLGYGTDEDGESKNMAVLMRELGEIFYRCESDTGYFASDEDEARANVLVEKLHTAMSQVSEQHVKLTADVNYLNSNLKQLNTTKDTLNEQIENIEQIDPADAITSMLWAQYSYNAALRIGTNILSQSLIDYMN